MNHNTHEKVIVLLPHWAQHNRDHAAEVRKWQALLSADGDSELSSTLDQVAAHMEQAAKLLEGASRHTSGTTPQVHTHSHAH